MKSITSNATSNEVVSAYLFLKEKALEEAEEYAEKLIGDFVTHLSMMSASEILELNEKYIYFNVYLELDLEFKRQVFRFLGEKNIYVDEKFDDDGKKYYRLITTTETEIDV